VDSRVGQGTTFRIYLPRVAPSTGTGGAAADAVDAQGSETILLVEDEERVLELTGEMLSETGYTVLPAHGPAEALQLAATHAGAIDLLLTDVIMPQMNGTQLAERLLTARPGLRVLYMSGYTFDTMANRAAARATVRLIEKPFTLQTLTEKVREVLDS